MPFYLQTSKTLFLPFSSVFDACILLNDHNKWRF